MDELFNNINKNIEELTSQPSSKKRFKLKKSKKRTVTIYSKPQVNHIKLNKEDIDKIKKTTFR